MKFIVALVLSFLVVGGSQLMNEDEIRDEINYATNRRSKRAVCEKPVQVTRPPILDPYCYGCLCRPFDLIVSKRIVIDPINPIIRPRCLDWNRCCGRFGGLTSDVQSKSSISDSHINQMAANLVAKFGKRATADNKFKKPSVDLVFLIDDSGSIPDSQFKVAKEGAATFSQALCPKSFGPKKGDKQVSVVLFSTTPQTVITFEESQKGAGHVEDVILNMKQRAGATATTDAIKHIRENILGKGSSRLNDPDTATIVFVITDGKCNDGCSQLKAEAQKLREAGPGVQVFAFGVGEADCTELEEIRGKESGEVFGLPDFHFFEKLANAVKQHMAKNGGSCLN